MFTLALLLIPLDESKLTLKPGWKATTDFPSEHATQAAAADEKHFYAVSNTTVAVYDRGTGKLVAVSDSGTTPAEHLNSAFVWKGKVYCAHSNYPKKPETSEVRVYDPATNKLTTFTTSSRTRPGSLVWNVHDGKNWWCCFAHYQDDNAKTILCQDGRRSSRNWQRWTFPKAVVDDWDKMSASGGVWDGDTLLVSPPPLQGAVPVEECPKTVTSWSSWRRWSARFPGQGVARRPEDRRAGRHRPRQAPRRVRHQAVGCVEPRFAALTHHTD